MTVSHEVAQERLLRFSSGVRIWSIVDPLFPWDRPVKLRQTFLEMPLQNWKTHLMFVRSGGIFPVAEQWQFGAGFCSRIQSSAAGNTHTTTDTVSCANIQLDTTIAYVRAAMLMQRGFATHQRSACSQPRVLLPSSRLSGAARASLFVVAVAIRSTAAAACCNRTLVLNLPRHSLPPPRRRPRCRDTPLLNYSRPSTAAACLLARSGSIGLW